MPLKVKIIRGAFLNPFEMQNYTPLKDQYDIEVISSKHPISDKINLPLKKLYSPTDLPNFPYKYPILNRLLGDAQILYKLDDSIKRADIVHVAETYFGYTRQSVLAKRRNLIKKVITTVWETIPGNNETLSGRRKNKNYCKENIDHFIAVTNRAKNSLISEGVNQKKISVIPMGVDLTRFKQRPHKRNKRDINILCVARLVEEKGILSLVKVFLLLKKQYKNIHLTLVGDGPLKKDLTGYKNIHIKSVAYNKIHLEYANADIFCLLSKTTKTWEEQFGMSLVEAMACGLPVIATNCGAIPEVCGEAAIIINQQNEYQLESAIKKLINSKSLREDLGKKGLIRVKEKYDIKKTSNQIAKIYQRICP